MNKPNMDNRIKKMAELLCNYSLELKAGETLLVRAMSPCATSLVEEIYKVALSLGAIVFPYIHLSREDTLALSSTSDLSLLATPSSILKQMYESCNTIIRIEADEDPTALMAFPADKQKSRAKFHSELISIQMRREGAGELRRVTTLYPTEGYAKSAGMTLAEYTEFVFGACKLNLADPVLAWQKLGQFHEKLIKWLEGRSSLTVKGENIDLTMSIKGRIFENCCGKINLPDGEIYTGPVENSVNGWVKFSYPAYYRGNCVEGAELYFKDGKVCEAKARKNLEFLVQTLDTDAGARRVGEFAIGTNREITKFSGSILFDEKIGDTVHLAVGQGYPKTGSVNESAVHWDMICDMRSGGTIAADGETLWKDGSFVIS